METKGNRIVKHLLGAKGTNYFTKALVGGLGNDYTENK